MKKALAIFTLLTSFLTSANSAGNVELEKKVLSEQLKKLGYMIDKKNNNDDYNEFYFYSEREYRDRFKQNNNMVRPEVSCENCAVFNKNNIVMISIYLNDAINSLNLTEVKRLKMLELTSRSRHGSISNLRLPSSIIYLSIFTFGKEVSDLRFLSDVDDLKYLSYHDRSLMNLEAIEHLDKLEYLKLSGNRIKDVRSVKNMPKLKYLDLMRNKVKSVPGDVLPDSIEYLLLGSEVTSLPEKLPNNLVHLSLGVRHLNHTLNLKQNNKLKVLSTGGSSKCKEIGLNIPDSLQDISATRCRMEKIAFPKNTQLKKVDLENNPIKVIDPPQTHPTIEELSLSNTRITSLDGIEHFPNLKKLQLRDCKLLIDISAIKHLKQLEEVDLSENIALKDISPLYHLKNIRIINLEDAENADLPEDPTVWPNIKEFYPPDHYTHEELRKIDAWVYDRKKL
ncbi:leucine-rich repeat domain-containing protein [Zooshikella sp. RANM57]|uniref:leucine-rich repeat domain-containing protein n=1 Tax=Zooshikella sp. RANM57 TaxID=3425863 RepID=UPI003D6EB3B3